MTVLKEKDISHPLYAATLENGIKLTVYGDYATGSDGKTYYHVGEEIDDVLQTIGWSSDINKAVIFVCTQM